jgi:hypothetical protein
MVAMTQPASAGFPVTTAFSLPGMAVEQDLGVAFGLVVRSMGAIKSIGAGFKAMRQGEVTQYTELLEDSRRHAIDRAGSAGPAAARGGRGRAGQRRRHAQRAEPDPAWVPTPERFRDPSTSAIIRVWIDPADLSRHYVPEPDLR